MIVRLILDLEDPLARDTIAAYERACEGQKAPCALRFHHLPLARHERARELAIAALAMRRLRGPQAETAFVRALLAGTGLAAPAVQAAANAALPSLPEQSNYAGLLSDGATKALLERERAALIALGVRATPSAIVNGRGIAGLPPARALQTAVSEAHKEFVACGADALQCEQKGVARHGGGASRALAALVSGKGLADSQVEERPVGRLGERFKVELRPADLRIGTGAADVTAVYFIDPGAARQRAALAALIKAVADNGDRLVLKLLPRAGYGPAAAANVRLALALTTIALRSDAKVQAQAVRWLAKGGAAADLLAGLADLTGTTAAVLDAAIAAPATTVALEQSVRGAARVDARPGSLYINGKRWLGRADDEGIDQVLELARTEAWSVRRKAKIKTGVYDRLIARGRVRSEAEQDLDEEEDLGDLAGIPDLGTAAAAPAPATDVWLFVDFRSLASRAAFHILAGLRESADFPVRLHVASMASSAEPAVTPSGAVFVAAHLHGRGFACARRLFSVSDSNDWRVLRAVWKRLGLSRKLLQPAIVDPRTKRVSETVERLLTAFDMDSDPVIYVGKRRYVGPIDEARIERAVGFVAAEAHP